MERVKASDVLSEDDRAYFTVIFAGDIGKYPSNPLDVETPFGKPVAVGRGDAFAEIDRLLTSTPQS